MSKSRKFASNFVVEKSQNFTKKTKFNY